MTTDHEQAATVLATMTLSEIKSLKRVEAGEEPQYMEWFSLKEKKLVSWSSDKKMVLTPNGRAVLALLQPETAQPEAKATSDRGEGNDGT